VVTLREARPLEFAVSGRATRHDTLRYDVTEARWVSVSDGSEGTGG